MITTRSCLRTITEVFFVMISGFLLWMLGLRIGLHGGQGLYREILPESSTLLHILYGTCELLIGIIFFIMLRRQVLPGGMKELVPTHTTALSKVKYFPIIFSFGVVAGLAGDALVIFMVELILRI